MSTRQSTVDFIVDQLTGAGNVRAAKMFGEYGLYCDSKIVALICDDQVFLKPTEAGRAYIGAVTEGFAYNGAKPSFLISEDLWDDGEWFSGLVRATAQALPLPVPKKPKLKRVAGK